MTEKRLARLVVLISGNGSNLQALIDACEAGYLPAEVVGVISNRPEAYGVQRAERHHIPVMIQLPRGLSRAGYDAQLSQCVAHFEPDWVILAGWMRLLSMAFLRHFPGRVINLHPALPGQFPGTHAVERAFDAAQRGEIEQTGVMVHLVPDEGVDNGPVLASQMVPILPGDSLETLVERVHMTERQLLVETIRGLVKEPSVHLV